MSELRLKSGVSFLPNGMDYIDKRTGYKVSAYERGLENAVSMLIEHRKANPRVYPASEYVWFSPSAVKQEFLRMAYETRPDLFKGQPVATATRTENGFPKACPCGGTSFSPEYCRTCGSGQRITGHRCDKCGKLYSL